jgi:hypothetical protein
MQPGVEVNSIFSEALRVNNLIGILTIIAHQFPAPAQGPQDNFLHGS